MVRRTLVLWRQVWKDPVGGSLIAAVIFAGAGYLYSFVVTPPALLARRVAGFAIPAIAIVAAILLWRRYNRASRILVFVSSGGTCRDPMAKAIMEQVLEKRQPRPRIEVRAAALGPVSGTEASYAAKHVIRELYGRDLLKDHHPELLTPELVERADLILAMDKGLLLTKGKTLPTNKAFVLKEFLGLKGDVKDPWPDGKDSQTIERYRACALELQSLLTQHADRIVNVLDV